MSAPSRAPLQTADLVIHTALPWPLPGAGDTALRWRNLSAVARNDLSLVKLVEPHHDATAILADLGYPAPRDREVWAVWAAEPPSAVVTATQRSDEWHLSGTKAFCSGAAVATHALVTAQAPDGARLFAIDVSDVDGGADSSRPWAGQGMARAGTVTLTLTDVPAQPVGGVGAYVDRVGFWLGAIGIAACWWGGARGVADTLERASDRLDAHGLAHLGAVRASLDCLQLALEAAARRVDDEDLTVASAERLAHTLRAQAAEVVENVVSHVGRALGPGPLAFDARHSEHVADLQVFVRQHHAERDLERLGSMADSDA